MHPLPLQPNDKVALVCTGSICTDPNHPQQTKEYLQTHYQLQAQFHDHINQSLSPQQRASILLSYLLDDDIKLISAMRGGEGTADILPYLHEHHDKIKKVTPKWMIGFSDTTALLVYFENVYGWPVVHGASPKQFFAKDVDQKTELTTMNLLFGKPSTDIIQLSPLNDFARKESMIEATLTGGNLSLIDISIKDLWEIQTKNKIIFFEDCAEKAHKIIRTLKYFSRIGMFEHAKAIILGDFTCWPIGCEHDEQEKNRVAILKVLASFANHLQLPVLYTTEFGHGKTNMPLIYCRDYALKLGELCNLAPK